MVNYIYLGYGVTDSNGVAKLDHDANGNPISHSYTGTGAGEIDIVASLDNPIDESSIQSERCSLLDTIKYDNAIIEDCNDEMWDGATINRGTEYSTISSTSTVYLHTSITGDICIELDIMTDMASSGTILQIRNNTTNIQQLSSSACGMVSNEWKHLKIKIQNNKLSIEDTSTSDLDVTDFNRFYLRASANYQTNFKNVKIYSL